MIISLRGAFAATKQSPVSRGDCFATCARNDTQTASLWDGQSATGDELDALSSSPSPSASLRINSASGIPSVLRPSGGAFKGEL
jgi:hypothetical protein